MIFTASLLFAALAGVNMASTQLKTDVCNIDNDDGTTCTSFAGGYIRGPFRVKCDKGTYVVKVQAYYRTLPESESLEKSDSNPKVLAGVTFTCSDKKEFTAGMKKKFDGESPFDTPGPVKSDAGFTQFGMSVTTSGMFIKAIEVAQAGAALSPVEFDASKIQNMRLVGFRWLNNFHYKLNALAAVFEPVAGTPAAAPVSSN